MEVIAKSSEIQLWMPIIAAFVSAIIGSILTIFTAQFIYRRTQIEPQEKAVIISIKYEIYRNMYQMSDLGRAANDGLEGYEKNKVLIEAAIKAGGRWGYRLIYCEPYYIAFEAMIRNGLISAFKDSEDALFSLYEVFREYDSMYKFLVESVNSPENAGAIGKISASLDQIIDIVEQQEKVLNEYFAKLDFISKDEWEKFREDKKKVLGIG